MMPDFSVAITFLTHSNDHGRGAARIEPFRFFQHFR
jgi:hypothetical protein